MKTKINSKLAIVLFAIVSFFALSSFLKAPEEKKQYATLRVFEPYAGSASFDARIIIVFEDGKVEEIDIDKFKSSNLAANTKKINETINQVSNKGYELISVSSGNCTTYTFLKNK